MKQNIHFDIEINAPVKKVWDNMLTDETYRQWTRPFDESSYYLGSWEKGSKIKFLSKTGDGIISEIVENILYEYISIKHLGEIKNQQESIWPMPAYENYTFVELDGRTDLHVDLAFEQSVEMEEMKQMFEVMWPKALKILKEICEKIT